MKTAYKLVRKEGLVYYSIYAIGMALTLYDLNKIVEVPQWLKIAKKHPFLFEDTESLWTFACNIRMLNLVDIEHLFVLTCECDKEATPDRISRLSLLKMGILLDSDLPLPYSVSYEIVIPRIATKAKDFFLSRSEFNCSVAEDGLTMTKEGSDFLFRL